MAHCCHAQLVAHWCAWAVGTQTWRALHGRRNCACECDTERQAAGDHLCASLSRAEATQSLGREQVASDSHRRQAKRIVAAYVPDCVQDGGAAVTTIAAHAAIMGAPSSSPMCTLLAWRHDLC
jgi:hypothetical protein